MSVSIVDFESSFLLPPENSVQPTRKSYQQPNRRLNQLSRPLFGFSAAGLALI